METEIRELLTKVLTIVKRQPRTTDTALAISLLNDAISRIVEKPVDAISSQPAVVVVDIDKPVFKRSTASFAPTTGMHGYVKDGSED